MFVRTHISLLFLVLWMFFIPELEGKRLDDSNDLRQMLEEHNVARIPKLINHGCFCSYRGCPRAVDCVDSCCKTFHKCYRQRLLAEDVLRLNYKWSSTSGRIKCEDCNSNKPEADKKCAKCTCDHNLAACIGSKPPVPYEGDLADTCPANNRKASENNAAAEISAVAMVELMRAFSSATEEAKPKESEGATEEAVIGHALDIETNDEALKKKTAQNRGMGADYPVWPSNPPQANRGMGAAVPIWPANPPQENQAKAAAVPIWPANPPQENRVKAAAVPIWPANPPQLNQGKEAAVPIWPANPPQENLNRGMGAAVPIWPANPPQENQGLGFRPAPPSLRPAPPSPGIHSNRGLGFAPAPNPYPAPVPGVYSNRGLRFDFPIWCGGNGNRVMCG